MLVEKTTSERQGYTISLHMTGTENLGQGGLKISSIEEA